MSSEYCMTTNRTGNIRFSIISSLSFKQFQSVDKLALQLVLQVFLNKGKSPGHDDIVIK